MRSILYCQSFEAAAAMRRVQDSKSGATVPRLLSSPRVKQYKVTINKISVLHHIIYWRYLKWNKGCTSEVDSLCRYKQANSTWQKFKNTYHQFLVMQQNMMHSLLPTLRIEKCECNGAIERQITKHFKRQVPELSVQTWCAARCHLTL